MRNHLSLSRILFFFLVSLIFGASDLRAQVIQEIRKNFDLYQNSSYKEKIYVQTDKTVFLPGELIWFKVYCVGDDNKPSDLSKVAYVELLDNAQNPVAQAKIALKSGSGNGSMLVPVTINTATCTLRAYTNWMKNFGPDTFFEKYITLINPLKSPEAPPKLLTSTYDVQFFPEGGNLVNGLNSKVAFKIVNQAGKGVNATGALVNQHNDTLVRFTSLKFGMGNFSFTPAANTSYRAVLKISGQKPIVKDLPAAIPQGYVMKLVDAGSDQLELSVTATNQDGKIYLFAHSGQKVRLAESLPLVNGAAHILFSKSRLGEGISHLTIFNSEKQPVCERLYFKRPEGKLNLEAGTDQSQYGQRKKVIVHIEQKNRAGKPADANLSFSVYRIDSLQEMDQSTILNYLWLSADLKGKIEYPDYYFSYNEPEQSQAADNLMLTQGWRKFGWKTILGGRKEAFTYLPEFTGHIITGRLFNTQNNLPAKNIMTYLGIPGKRVQMYTSKSDSNGRIFYNTKDFFGPGEIILQTNQQVDSIYRFDVLSPFSEQYSKVPLPGFSYNAASMQKPLEEHNLSTQVLNIYAPAELRKFYDPVIDSMAFYGIPGKTYKLDDFTRFTTMEEDLREYVSEDNIVKSKGVFHIKVLYNLHFLDFEPMLLVDGIPVFNTNKVIAIDPLKVRKLEVVNQNYFYGESEEEGIFSFTTYKGDLGGVELDPRALVVDYEGLQLKRQFYSPVYNSDSQVPGRIPDFRNLLYWNPDVDTKNGSLSFYTSDLKGKFVGIVQGMTSDGSAASHNFMFEVQ